MKGFILKVRTVARYKKPVADLPGEELDPAERREFAPELWVRWIGALRQHEPDAIVLRGPGMVPQHQDDSIFDVDREAREHPAHIRIQRSKGIQDKSMWRLSFGFRGPRHGCFTMDDSITGQYGEAGIEAPVAGLEGLWNSHS